MLSAVFHHMDSYLAENINWLGAGSKAQMRTHLKKSFGFSRALDRNGVLYSFIRRSGSFDSFDKFLILLQQPFSNGLLNARDLHFEIGGTLQIVHKTL